jgi:hypothetical protein
VNNQRLSFYEVLSLKVGDRIEWETFPGWVRAINSPVNKKIKGKVVKNDAGKGWLNVMSDRKITCVIPSYSIVRKLRRV